MAVASGVPPEELYVNEEIPHPLVTLNSEVYRSWRGLEARYSLLPDNMRPALRDGQQHAHGLKADMVLRAKCCDSGYDAVMGFLDKFQDHVIELTCFTKPFGTRGWRTIIWEVRNY